MLSIPLQEFVLAQDITMTTSRASLCALGEYLKRHCFFAPLQEAQGWASLTASTTEEW